MRVPSCQMMCLISRIKESSAKGKWQDVLLYYQSLRRAGIQLNDISIFPPILKACLNLSLSFTHGACIHASLLKHGFAAAFTSVGNSIIDFYSKSGHLGYAMRVFQSISNPDSVSWNTIIHAHLHQGVSPQEGLRLFYQARVAGFQSNVSALVLVIQTCKNLATFYDGQKIHGYVIRSGFWTVCSVQNSLLNFYVEFEMELARELFDEMSDRDIISWSVMIAGFVGSEEATLALRLFKEMMSNCGIGVDGQIVVSVLKGCSRLRDIKMGTLVHGFVTSRGLGLDLFVQNSLIDMYSKCNDMISALRAFSEMPIKNIVSWNSLLSGLVHNGNHAEALLLFDSMGKAGVVADEVTLVNLLQVCKHFDDPYLCKLIHSRIFRQGYELNEMVINSLIDAYARCNLITLAWIQFSNMEMRDAVTWSTMIAAFTNQGMPDKAIAVFQEMCMTSSVKPNSITMLNLLEACSLSADLGRSMWAHAIAIRRYLAYDVAVGTAILDMYSKCGEIEASRKAFEWMHCRNVVSWSAMIAAFGMNGLPNDALACLTEMKSHGLKPNPVTILSVLSACSHGGLIEKGLSLFEELVQDLEGEIGAEHYSCLIDLLARAGKLGSAMDLIERLPHRKKASASAWGAILSACRNYENNDIGFGALSQVLELETSSSSAYLLASSMYAYCHSWTDATKMRRLVNDRGMRVEGAYSLVHIDGRACKFLAGNNHSLLPDDLCLAIERLHSSIKVDCGE